MTELKRRRRPALVVALVTTLAFLLTGCSFWDWLAGRPITRPEPMPAAVDGPDAPQDGDEAGSAGPSGDSPSDDGDSGPAAGEDAPGLDETGEPAGDPEPAGDDGGTDVAIVPDRCSIWSAGIEPSPGPFERVTLEPVDDAGKEPSFVEFRTNLLQALARRDVAALEAAIHPEVKTDFGGGTGLADFRRQWGLDRDPDASPVWDVLTDILNLGGIMTGGGDGPRLYTAPYVYALYNASLDPFGHAVVTGAGVNVRAEPSVEAEILDQATHLVVRVLETEGEPPTIELSGRTYCWVKIQLPSGEIGYVADRFLWSPVGWRAAFEQGDDGWRLIFLVAGD